MVDLQCMANTTPCPSDFHNTLENTIHQCRVLVKSMQQLQNNNNDVNAIAVDKILELYNLASMLKTYTGVYTPIESQTEDSYISKRTITTHKIVPKRFDALRPRPMVPNGEGWGSNQPTASVSQPSIWTGFYNKTLRERYNVLSLMYPRLDSTTESTTNGDSANTKFGELPVRTADLMIENCIGVLGIPLGLGLNFVIDGQHLSVPMAVEEPSVVAAASSAAKLVATMGGGFHTATTGNIMTSQVQLVDTPDIAFAIANIAKHRGRLLHMANTNYCANMYKRGGGAVDIYCRVVKQSTRHKYTQDPSYWYTPCDDELLIQASSNDVEYIVVHIDVDVCEAMGANIVNTVAERLSNEICVLTNSRCGLRILTNLCMQRRARSTFEIPIKKLGWKGMEGEQVAARIIEAYNFAAIDPYRAVTNNKGVMNGIDAVAVATGQDWRAIEASAHCYASRTGQYATLTKYEIIEQADGTRALRGCLELPIAVGSKGGALQTHPGYKAMHTILHHPTAKALSSIIVSVGLAQNFAAIRAIAVTGIQKGHMALHARNIAVAAGAPSELVAEVCSYMLGREAINVETAQEYLQAHEVFSEIHNNSPPLSPQPVTLPSILYVEIPVPRLETKVSVNIAFESINKHPQYISIMAQHPTSPSNKEQPTEPELPLIQRQLLGDKGYNQLEKMFMFLASMRSIVTLQTNEPSMESPITRANLALQNKLQLLTVLINILAHRLMELRPQMVGTFLRQLLASSGTRALHHVDAVLCRELLADVPPSDDVLSTGLPLLLALSQVLLYHLEQDVPHALIRERIASEQWNLLSSIVDSFEMIQQQIERTPDVDCEKQLEQFMSIHSKRWQATMLLLIDSLALSPELITSERMEVLYRIGEYMEWEGTIAHDIARYSRAATESVPNSFIYWLHLQGIESQDGGAFIPDFQQVMANHRALKWQRIVDERNKLSHSIFSLPAVERVTQIVRDVYAERSGERSRCQSF